MHFMNEWEIAEAKDRWKKHPVLGPATILLWELKELVNDNSDGWCYWKAPVKAAKMLMTLIENPATATEAGLKQAITPIKRFCTRHKLPFPEKEQP